MSSSNDTDWPDRPWTITEVAAYLSLHPRTIENRIRDSGLPYHRIGSTRRFLRAEIDAWLASQPSQPKRVA